MSGIHGTLQQLRLQWSAPRKAAHPRGESAFELCCRFSPDAATAVSIAQAGEGLPAAVRAFRAEAESAELFIDVTFGQWGLKIFGPVESAAEWHFENTRARTPIDRNDLVVGRFLGDSELLIVRSTHASNAGQVLIGMPVYPRKDWLAVADDFADFLDRHARAEGARFLE